MTVSTSRIALSFLLINWACAGQDGWSTWSTWSAWSECSRTCDGGASYQLRHCIGNSICKGDSIQYKTCNNEACPPESGDFRSQQCAAYNDVPHKGHLYSWVPSVQPHDPCSLRCEAQGVGFIVMLAPKVLDGTRCNEETIDMCINGKCRTVGCDHMLESGAREDACGECEGDGRRCSHPPPRASFPFVWHQAGFSKCSASCGVGHQLTSVVCRDRRTQRVVYEGYCDAKSKPSIKQRECRMPRCAPVWITGEWQSCSKSCGGGILRRHLYCVEELKDGTFRRIYDGLCRDPKPRTMKTCNKHSCPKWYAGEWSPCSITCGTGIQYREVICRKTEKYNCSQRHQPAINKFCYTNVPCIGEKAEAHSNASAASFKAPKITSNRTKGRKKHKTTNNVLTTVEHTVTHIDMLTSPTTSVDLPGSVKDILSAEDSTTVQSEKPMDDEVIPTKSQLEVEISSTPTVNPTEIFTIRFIDDKNDVTQQPIRIEDSHYHPIRIEDAGRNSIRYQAYGAQRGRQVKSIKSPYNHQGVLEEWNNDYDYNDRNDYNDYNDGSGSVEDYDILQPNGNLERNNMEQTTGSVTTTPSFISSAWGGCSVTCGVGIRSRIVQCKVYLEFSRTVQDLPDNSCTGYKPPEIIECRLDECLINSDETEALGHSGHIGGAHVWKLTGYDDCSEQCLGGTQRSIHRCVRVADDLPVDEAYCLDVARPIIIERPCNPQPCPPRWRADPYGPCSIICGGGYQRRNVECIQELGRGEENIAKLPDEMCPQPIPQRSLMCNLIDCDPAWETLLWGQCSTTCGEGVEMRKIECKQIVTPGEVRTVDDNLCPALRPATRRPCFRAPCPANPSQTKPYIDTEEAIYVQLVRQRKFTAVVGGKVVAIPGTTIVVRCPVKGYNRTMVHWRRKEDYITRIGRIKISKHGALHIKKSRLDDEGVYTCVIEGSVGNVSVTFHSETDAHRHLIWRRQFFLRNYRNAETQDKVDHSSQGESRGKHNDVFFEGGPLISSVIGQDANITDIPYLFVTTDWSSCSRSCGGAGLKMRNITCESVTENYYKIVDDEFCEDYGQEKPLETQDCGFERCPHWEASGWSECSDQMCSRNWVGIRKRHLYCVMPNGTLASADQCAEDSKPEHIRECRNENCIATWKTSTWTKCSKSCGGTGFRTRMLQCVWSVNQNPAGVHCKGLVRPLVAKPCESPSCSTTTCHDESKYCSLAPMLRLCRLKSYRQQCCYSCRKARVRKQRQRRRQRH